MRRRTLPAGVLLGAAAAPALAAASGPSVTCTGGTMPDSRRYAVRHTAGRGAVVTRRVVVDDMCVARDGVLSAVYREKSTGTTPSLPHVVDLRLPA
ncbi:hypothetical protein [Streptomyces sp. NPDC014676]|uniref:hypothetical protein n=1 Tax=Streptomyces sp. NPDC014676 TaxID=3364879 RepID=UPI003702B51D